MSRIAERATINRVTFYLHYRDIPDMLEKMADEMVTNIRQILNEEVLSQISANEVNWIAIEKLFEHFAEHADFYKVVLASNQIPIFTERLLNLMEELLTTSLENMEADAFIEKSGIPKDIILWYFSSALMGTIIMWLQNDMPYTPAFLTKQFSLLVTH